MSADTEAAAAVAGIWSETLGVDSPDPAASFFSLGGDSLAVELLLERLAQVAGVRLGLQEFFADPTLAGVIGALDRPPEPVQLADALTRYAAAHPQAPALTGPDGTVSYAELAELAGRAAAERRRIQSPRLAEIPSTVAGAVEFVRIVCSGRPTLLVGPTVTTAERQRAWERFAAEFDGPVLRRAPQHPAAARVIGTVTSGTSGEPKVVLVPVDGYVQLQAACYDLRPGEGHLVMAPLHWGFGNGPGVLTGLLGGATVVLPVMPLTPGGLAEAAGRADVAATIGVGFAYRLLLASDAALPQLRLALTGGEPLSAELAAEWERRTGVRLTDTYGTSEAGHLVANLDHEPGVLGRPLPGVTLAVRQADGSLRRTGVGELVADSPSLALGYAGDPRRTAERFGEGGFRTGDLAEITPDGQVVLRGRLDDTINVDGNKVDPAEVEAALCELDGVREAAVVGNRLGNRVEVCAYVVADRPVIRADVLPALRGRLSSYKIPSRIETVPELPRTATGKVRREALSQ